MTARKEMIRLLLLDQYSARELSQILHMREKEVVEHLEHVLRAYRGALKISPAQCLSCGFVFVKRRSPASPGKCPRCRQEHISDPRFRLVRDRQH